jgi:ribonuclease I
MMDMDDHTCWKFQWWKHGSCSGESWGVYIHETLSLYDGPDAINIFVVLAANMIFPIDDNEPPVFHTRAAFQRALGSMFLPIENDPREIRLELSSVEWQIYEIKICTTTDRLPIYWYM